MRRLDVRLVSTAAAGGAWLAFYAAWLAVAPGGERGLELFSNTAYQVPIVAALALGLLAWRRSPGGLRRFWALLTLSNLVWLASELLWAARELGAGDVPFPWWTDAGYLTSYVLVGLALFAALKPTLRTISPTTLLEAVLVTGSLALVWWEVVLRPLPLGLDAVSIVGLAYPLLGLVLLGTVVSVRLLPTRRGNLSVRLVAVGIACTALADGLYAHAVVTHSYLPGAWIALGWQAEAVLFAAAAWVAVARPAREPSWRRVREPRTVTGAAVALTLGALVASLSHAASTSGTTVPLVVAAAVLAGALGARVWLLLDPGSDRDLWDPETGVYLEESAPHQLRLLAARARHFSDPFAVVVTTLDGPADRVRPAVEGLLLGSARPVDSVVRLRGPRWALLLGGVDADGGRATAESVRAAAAAQGLTPSVGVAIWSPDDGSSGAPLARAERAAADATLLLGNQVRTEADSLVLEDPDSDAGRLELLLSLAEAVDEREGLGRRHSEAVADVAREVARELGIGGGIASIFLAGLVHDVGKTGIADGILVRPGPLTEAEWDVLRRQPLLGAGVVRRLGDAEAASFVETQHERWDGSGYPRGLAGERIPLGGRILAVANALVAMTTKRPFRPAMTVTAALTELWRGSDSRYDAGVVSALLALGRDGRLAIEAARPGREVRVPL